MSENQEAAWRAYREKLGPLTRRAELLAESSFKAGWRALAELLKAQVARMTGDLCPRCGKPKMPDSSGHRHTGHLCCGYSTDRDAA